MFLFLLEKGKYHLVVGADGPCKVSFNIGGKIFRAHHDEISKGLISDGKWL
jgi:hypothetical protein